MPRRGCTRGVFSCLAPQGDSKSRHRHCAETAVAQVPHGRPHGDTTWHLPGAHANAHSAWAAPSPRLLSSSATSASGIHSCSPTQSHAAQELPMLLCDDHTHHNSSSSMLVTLPPLHEHCTSGHQSAAEAGSTCDVHDTASDACMLHRKQLMPMMMPAWAQAAHGFEAPAAAEASGMQQEIPPASVPVEAFTPHVLHPPCYSAPLLEGTRASSGRAAKEWVAVTAAAEASGSDVSSGSNLALPLRQPSARSKPLLMPGGDSFSFSTRRSGPAVLQGASTLHQWVARSKATHEQRKGGAGEHGACGSGSSGSSRGADLQHLQQQQAAAAGQMQPPDPQLQQPQPSPLRPPLQQPPSQQHAQQVLADADQQLHQQQPLVPLQQPQRPFALEQPQLLPLPLPPRLPAECPSTPSTASPTSDEHAVDICPMNTEGNTSPPSTHLISTSTEPPLGSTSHTMTVVLSDALTAHPTQDGALLNMLMGGYLVIGDGAPDAAGPAAESEAEAGGSCREADGGARSLKAGEVDQPCAGGAAAGTPALAAVGAAARPSSLRHGARQQQSAAAGAAGSLMTADRAATVAQAGASGGGICVLLPVRHDADGGWITLAPQGSCEILPSPLPSHVESLGRTGSYNRGSRGSGGGRSSRGSGSGACITCTGRSSVSGSGGSSALPLARAARVSPVLALPAAHPLQIATSRLANVSRSSSLCMIYEEERL